MGQPVFLSAPGEGARPPCCSKTSTHALMHSSHIYTDGPATSRPTASESRKSAIADLPALKCPISGEPEVGSQNEQRDFDRNRCRATPASFANRLIALYPRFARAKQPAIGSELMVPHRCGAPWALERHVSVPQPGIKLGSRRSFRP